MFKMYRLTAFLAGALFGTGLLVSDMVDTTKVQGWLDVFGDWDPTLAFVLAGAILPMAVAWQVAERKVQSRFGQKIPGRSAQPVDGQLVAGSLIFGLGWGLVGLCPGPALAAMTYGGQETLMFIAAMCVGMILARPVKQRLAQPA